jgi:hypothetical protein
LLILGTAGIFMGILSLAIPFSVPRHQDIQKGSGIPRGKALTTFISICFVMVFSGLMYRAFMTILPAFQEMKVSGLFAGFARTLSASTAGKVLTRDPDTLIAAIVASAALHIGILGQFVGGHVADRSDLRYSYLAFFSMALPFAVFLYCFEGPILIVASGIYTFFILGIQPIENSLVAMVTPPQWRSLSYGIKFTIVFGFGALAVIMVSTIEKSFGIDPVMMLIVALLAMVIITLLVLIFLTRDTSIRHEH